jgi:hypothetical protein
LGGANTDIYGQRFNAAGAPQGAEFQVNTYTTDGQLTPSVTMDADGDFVVVWRSFGQDGDFSGVYGQRFSATGAPVGPEFRVNTLTAGDQLDASVAMDADGDFVVAWYNANFFPGIYAQRYNASGVPQGGEFRLSPDDGHHRDFPSVAMEAGGDFVVAWRTLNLGAEAKAWSGVAEECLVGVGGEVGLGDRAGHLIDRWAEARRGLGQRTQVEAVERGGVLGEDLAQISLGPVGEDLPQRQLAVGVGALVVGDSRCPT